MGLSYESGSVLQTTRLRPGFFFWFEFLPFLLSIGQAPANPLEKANSGPSANCVASFA